MKHIISSSILLAASCLSGCVTTKELRVKQALIDVASSKTSLLVATCITEAWRPLGVFGMSMDVQTTVLAEGDGYAVFIKNNQVVQLLADVRDSSTGSTTKFYKPGFVAATGKFQAAVRDCQ